MFKFFLLLIYKQKAGLHYCCSAIRGSSIAFSSKQQHCSPRRMYRVRAIRVHEYTLTGILVSQCSGTYEFARFRIAKTQRIRRFSTC